VVGFLVSIVPSAGALFLFWLALRAIFQADRRERAAIASYESGRDRQDEHGPAEPSAGPTADRAEVGGTRTDVPVAEGDTPTAAHGATGSDDEAADDVRTPRPGA
jgi:hypothetical protein